MDGAADLALPAAMAALRARRRHAYRRMALAHWRA
jgi:hypothetical protein